MRHLDFYYALRRFIPRRLQIALRQGIARRIRKRCSETWPVDPAAGRMPPNWPGWPDGKKFALVLTHDVEGPGGLRKCLRLAELEEKAGFRSSVNFIPAARYQVPDALREELIRRGFEVGVHGLLHDGRDFQSRPVFEKRAPRMNEFIHAWGAAGFRAPSMRSNLDWIRDLDVEYDTSTFDTDPFEPVPQGVHTIFPFRIERDHGRPGYIEMPYTLPQDLTLFVLLGENHIETWKRKLAWIAECGGMALLDSHPDYMDFEGTQGIDEYPAARYAEFLDYVKREYAGRYWHALPRDVARYCAARPAAIRCGRPRHVCMMAYAFYQSDNRIIRYAETLARRGDSVDVIALRREGQPDKEVLNDVRVFCIQERKRDEKGRLSYLFRLVRFFFRSARFIARRHAQRPYQLVHVHSVPDFEIFAAWRPKLGGARLILDIHDLVPEFYSSKFGVNRNSLAFRALLRIERLSAAFADHVIIANHIWQKKLVGRSVAPEHCSVVLNYADPAVFYPRPRTRTDGRFLVVYPGGMQWHQGLDIVIRGFARAAAEWPAAELHFYGEGSEQLRLRALVKELGLEDRVRFLGVRLFQDIPGIVAQADLGIVAKRADSFGNEAYSTKILEYFSQGVPVIVSRTAIDQHYFPEDVVRFFTSGSVDELADAILELARDPELRARFAAAGRAYVARNNWDIHKKEYLDLVDNLIAGTRESKT